MDAAGNALEERHDAYAIAVRPEELLGFGHVVFALNPAEQVRAAVDPVPRVACARRAVATV